MADEFNYSHLKKGDLNLENEYGQAKDEKQSRRWPVSVRANRTAKFPFAYEPIDKDSVVLIPHWERIQLVEQAFQHVDRGHSFREAAQWLVVKTGKSLTYNGLRNLYIRINGRKKTPRNERAKERKEANAPNSPEEAQERQRKSRIAAEKRRITATKKRLAALEGTSEVDDVPIEDKEALASFEAAYGTLIDADILEKVVYKDQEIIFKPNPGPQTAFLAATEREILYGGAAGGGKGLKPDANILTPFGWTKLKDLKVGSKICSVDGTNAVIIGYYPRGIQPFYKITFLDGSVVECDKEHLWLTHTAGKGKKINGTRVFGPEGSKLWTTLQIYNHYQKDSRRLGIPLCKPTQFTVAGTAKGPKKFIKRELDPYTLGVLLGDGSITNKSNATFTSEDPEIAERIGATLGITLARYDTRSNAYCYRIPSSFVNEPLEDLELWGKRSEVKRIPRIYLMATEEERWALLQGLMDTDGYADNEGDAFFCSVSEGLVDDVRHLARSLGCLVYKTTKSTRYYEYKGERREGQTAYDLRIKCPTPEKLFHLSRKKERVADKQHQSVANWIVSVEKIEDAESICIAVDHPSRLFITDNFVVTHNTMALIADPMRYFHNPNFNGLLLRRTNDELREIIWKTQELYPQVYPGAKWQEKKSQWVFPSGARYWLTYLERDEDVLRYQGQAWCHISFDELGQYATPFAFNYMRSRLRSTDPTLPLCMRASANPGGPGMHWVKRAFVDPSPPNTKFAATDLETGDPLVYPKGHAKEGQALFYRRFIPATLYDNPYLAADGVYEANLLSLPEMQRRQLLEGDWTISDGAAFPEFRAATHSMEPYEIPHNWTRFRSCDFGYSSHSAVHWFAVDPAYETLIVYRELYVAKHTAKDLALKILDLERGEQLYYGVLDSSCWHSRGHTGPSIAEEMIREGVKWRPSDRTAGSRVAGKNRLHELLKVDPDTNMPGIVFFNNCRQIIADMQIIPVDPKGGDDIDVRFSSDHAYDSIRYGIMSRPKSNTFFDWMNKPKTLVRPSDPIFGY